MEHIPVIDFSSCKLNGSDSLCKTSMYTVGESLYDALKTFGFAYLKNCGISQEEVDIVNTVTGQFFTASFEEKKKYARRPDNFGYVGLDTEQLDPANPTDYKEAFNITSSSLSDPSIDWPSDISPQFFSTIENFMEKCKLLTLRILKVLGIGMKLADTDHFAKSHSLLNARKGNHTALRTIYYPPLTDDDNVNRVRLGSHSDYGSITLLFQDTVGGLQVQNIKGEFVDAIPIKDTVLINIGDLLQFWSQNRLKSTKHRVVNSTDSEKRKQVRRSMAYFVHPDDDVLVDEELVFEDNKGNKKKSKSLTKSSLTAYEYLLMKFDQTYKH